MTPTINKETLNKRSRAGYSGKQIQCPKCSAVRRVYHLAWSALSCTDCATMIDKYDWLVY